MRIKSLFFLILSCLWLGAFPAQAQGRDYVILALGDSLTAGYGLRAEDSMPAKLQARLLEKGWRVRVINAGVSGDTTSGGLARLDWALADRPDIVLVALGANDALRAVDPAVTRRNLSAILEKLRAEAVTVILSGMKAPRNLGADYITQFDNIYPELAEQFGTLFHPFYLEGVATVADLNQQDGLHPTAEGIDRVVDGLLPVVEDALRQVEAGRQG